MRISWRLVVTGSAALLVIGGAYYLCAPKLQAAWVRQQGKLHNAQAVQDLQQQTVAVKEFSLQDPVALDLPRLHLALAIKPGTYNASSQTWQLDRQNAFFMQPVTDHDSQVIPATPVIYGHDIPAVFMPLNGVAKDEILTITQSNGTTYTLRYVGDVVVKPHETTALTTHYPNTVLLMTCTGTYFQERRILRFEVLGTKQTAYSEADHAYLA